MPVGPFKLDPSTQLAPTPTGADDRAPSRCGAPRLHGSGEPDGRVLCSWDPEHHCRCRVCHILEWIRRGAIPEVAGAL